MTSVPGISSPFLQSEKVFGSLFLMLNVKKEVSNIIIGFRYFVFLYMVVMCFTYEILHALGL